MGVNASEVNSDMIKAVNPAQVLSYIPENLRDNASNIMKTGDLSGLSQVDPNEIKQAVSNVDTQQVAQQLQAAGITKADGSAYAVDSAILVSAVDSASSALAGITLPSTIPSEIMAALQPENPPEPNPLEPNPPVPNPPEPNPPAPKTSAKKAPAKKKPAKKASAKKGPAKSKKEPAKKKN
jgi:hypothetical protein